MYWVLWSVIGVGWFVVARLLKQLDASQAAYADVCRRLQEASGARLALIAQINDFKSRALDAEACARAHQSRAEEIRKIYMDRADAAAKAPIGDALTFLREQAAK